MKKKWIAALAALLLISGGIRWLGVGAYSSDSAVLDLHEELSKVHGAAYIGKETDSGTEDMVFEVEAKTRFLTNWNLRQWLGLDYEYECRVIITAYTDGQVSHVRTITYRAVDPMGADEITERAHLILDSRTETARTVSLGTATLP